MVEEAEGKTDRPRAILGMFDVSARPYVPADTLSFAVPMAKFQRMIDNMEESFLTTLGRGSAILAERIEKANLASIKWPSDGKYLGTWQEGEKIAQSGQGMQYSQRVQGMGLRFSYHWRTLATRS